MGIDIGLLAEELKRDEGFEEQIYKCSAGKLSIGYGINLETEKLPERIAALWLDDKIGQVLAECERFSWFHALSDIRKRVILNMVYNLGFRGVSNFKKMIAAIEINDWYHAGNEMEDSKWAVQVGKRAARLVFMMKYDSTSGLAW